MLKHHIVFNPACEYRFDIKDAKDSYLWDTTGKKYIDFSSGWNTTNLGWNNAEINEALIAQTKEMTYAPMWTADPMQIAYAEALTNAFPEPLDTVLRATGGTEANELALKIARAVTGRKKIIGFKHTYHGQSFGTLAIGYIPDYVSGIAPLVPEFIQMDYPDAFAGNEKVVLETFLSKLESLLKTEDVAAFFTEAGLVTGWGSLLQAPDGYLTAVREVTDKYGSLLVVDEVGSGFSRTGKLFAIEHEQVIPDIVTLAKGISNGAAPLGAVVTKAKLVDGHEGKFKPTSTFGWTPLTCAVGLKTLEIHQRDKVWVEAERKGKLVKDILTKELGANANMLHLRGRGLEIGFDLSDNSKAPAVVAAVFAKGLHLADAGDCIQLMPPLTIADETLKEGVQILIDAVKKL